MKITPRMKSSLIQVSIANIFFLVVFLGLFFVSVLPALNEISTKKKDFSELYGKYETIQSLGMNYGEYTKTIKSGGNLDVYTKSLIKDVSTSFYNDNFQNTTSSNYDEFLSNLQNSIQTEKTSEDYKAKDILISTILPSYSQDNNLTGESNNITDFDFVNTVENILYDFNLSFVGEIGVGNLESIDEGNSTESENSTSGLSESIFKIPLQLSISGRKRDIVDFIHYFENVGTIDVSGDSLEVYNDNFIASKVTGGELGNVYMAQFSDIEMLQMQEYPDNSSLPSDDTLIEVLSTEQGKQRMNIDIILNFYLAGVPEYQMEQVLLDYFSSFQELKELISQSSKKYTGKIYQYSSSEQLLAINKLSSLEFIMEEMSEETTKLKKQYTKKESIQRVYEDASELLKQLRSIQAQHETIVTVLQ